MKTPLAGPFVCALVLLEKARQQLRLAGRPDAATCKALVKLQLQLTDFDERAAVAKSVFELGKQSGRCHDVA